MQLVGKKLHCSHLVYLKKIHNTLELPYSVICEHQMFYLPAVSNILNGIEMANDNWQF